MATIVVGNNPLNPKDTQTFHAPDGITLAEWEREAGLRSMPRICFANGLADGNILLISERQGFRLSAGDLVTFVPVPLGGGGGSNPLKVILAVALIAFATPIAGFAAGATGMAITAASVAKFGAAMLLSAFVQPKPVSAPGSALDIKEASPTYAVQAQGNLARLNAAIPRLYGRHMVYPYFIAAPWVEYVNGKQYLTQIFLIGHGRYRTEAPRMEDSPLTSFSRVTWSYVWYDTRGLPGYGDGYNGLGDDSWSNPRHHRVVTSGEVSGQVLLGTNEPNYDWVGPFVVNKAGTEIDTVQVDMIAPRGLYYANNDGSFTSKTVQWEFQAQAVSDDGNGTGGWLPLTTSQTFAGSSAVVYSIPTPAEWNPEEVSTAVTLTLDTGVKGVSGVSYDTSYSQNGSNMNNWYSTDGDAAELVSYSVVTGSGNDKIVAVVKPKWGYYSWGESSSAVWMGGVRFTFSYSYTSTVASPSMTAATNEAQVITYSCPVPPGRWQVRGRRIGSKDTSARAGHELRWAGLKGVLTTAPKYRDVTLLYVRIEASDKVSAQSSRKVNAVCTSILPVYRPDLGGWVDQPTRNPYWAMADIIRARYGANLPNGNFLDLEGLTDLAEAADARGDYFDYYADQRSTVWDALTLVGRTCRTVPSRVGGKLYFVRDQARTAPSAVISENQIRPGTLQIERMMPGTRSGSWIEAEYFDSKIWDWRKVAVGTAPPDPSALPLQIRLDGCTTELQATREATYMSRVNRHRRTFVTFETEMDAALITYGDLILVSHMLPDWGQTTFVKSVSGLTVTLANQIDWGTSPSLLMTFRLRNGKPSDVYTVTRGASDDIAVISSGSLPAEGLFLYGVATEPTTVLIGEASRWAASCLVTQIRPKGLENYTVSAVVDTGEVYDDRPWVPSLPLGAGTYTVPDGVYKIEVTCQGAVKGEQAYWVRYGAGADPPYDVACWLESDPLWNGSGAEESWFDLPPGVGIMAPFALPVWYDQYHISRQREGFTQVYDVTPGQQIDYYVGRGGTGEEMTPIPGQCLDSYNAKSARRGRDGEDGWMRVRVLA